MSQVSDVSIANQGFSAFRTELNNILGALNSMHSGTSRPSSAVVGTMWLDTTNSGSNSLGIKFFDGSDDISVATIDTSANTINFIDSVVTGFDIVGDTSPQLGGDLDTNSFNIGIDDAHFIKDENGNEQLIFQTTASAVNELEITNAASGNAPSLGASGETNVDLKIVPKGTGKAEIFVAGSNSATTEVLRLATGSSTDGSGVKLDMRTAHINSIIEMVDGTGSFDAELKFLTGTGSQLATPAERLAITGKNIKMSMGAYSPEIELKDASTITWDTSTQPVSKVTLTNNRTLGAATNALAGQFVSLLVIQDGSGSRTLSFNAVYEFTGDVAPTLTTTAAKGDLFVFRYNGAKFLEVGRNLNLTLS